MRTDLRLGTQPVSEYMGEFQILAWETHKKQEVLLPACYTRLKESIKHDQVAEEQTATMARDTESMSENPQTTHSTIYPQHMLNHCISGHPVG